MSMHPCYPRVLGHLLLVILVFAGTGLYAQPGPDACSVQITLATPDGQPIPYPFGGLITVSAQQRTQPGAMRLNVRNDGCTWAGLEAGPYVVQLNAQAWGLTLSQNVTLLPGLNFVTMTVPLTTLSCKLTVDGVPATPRVVVAGYRPLRSVCLPMPAEMRGSALVLAGLAPCAAQLLLSTDVGYTAVNVTIPPATPFFSLPVALTRASATDFVVTDTQQQPVPGAQVVLTGLPPENALAQLLLIADAHGAIRGLHLPPGRWRYAWDPAWQTAHPEFPVAGGVCVLNAKTLQPVALQFPRVVPAK